jgi:protease-4
MVDDIADSRGIDVKKLNVLADNLAGKNANSALKHSLVDGIVTQRNYDEKIKEIDEDVEFISLASYLNVPNSKKIKSSNRIAVVYAEGPIIYGEGSTEVIGSGKLVRTLKSIGKKDNIKAVVIRVNSPGGSAFASELIWEEIEELKKNKTVVVSMGNVAASGGYYISAGADEIVAMPTTITGSIGVLGTLPNFNKIATRWGVNAEQVMTNKQSMGYSPFEPVSNDFRNEVKSSIKQIYDTFLKRVSNGRSMSIEEVHEIAQGRVWSGKKAKEIGLIDHLGGMDVALERASKLADIEDYKISVYPKYIEDLETIYEELFSGPFGKIKNKLPSEIVMIFDSEKSLLTKKEIIQARIPYTLNIR